jgi:eukaryotic-like serine/threonine-protein kinase
MLSPGSVLADRFVLGELLGEGGMGQVFRALDRRSGLTVAVKLMLLDDPSSPHAARFAAEIGALSALAHPGIVAYVAHGSAEDGRPFLAMEYLEGEDLGARLARGWLPWPDALVLLGRVASALDEAHRRGIVHRDLKPSNLFLRGGDLGQVSILDFGIARYAGGDRSLTRTGTIVGTPEYMAPEQARGEKDVGPAADVFALGCVLYHALAGQPPFAADHVMATLAKILFEAPPSLAALRPDVPEVVCRLLSSMLEKDSASRPRDAGALVKELDALGALIEGAAGEARSTSAPARAAAGLGGAELELVSVIAMALPRASAVDATLDATAEAGGAGEEHGWEAARRVLSGRGLATDRLADGSIIATLGGGAAVDQAVAAVSAARLALAQWPGATVAVATARRVAGTGLPVGEALDRAATLLALPALEGRSGAVKLDDLTAGLISGRLSVASSPTGQRTLHEEAAPLDASRLLLGKPTPCVGRDQELAMLEMTMASSFDEGAARAILVVAPPGLGKSRLRHELLRRLAARGEPAAMRLEARGELLRAGSPHGVVAQALRRLFELDRHDGARADGGAAARATLLAAVERLVPREEARGVAELLGELCDVPFPDDNSVRLRTARQDPRFMQAQIGEAFLALLRAAAASGSVLILLEDLHWADRGSLELIGLALRELEEQPIFVVAFARPEIHDVAPGLWKGRVVELPLRPLGRRACERLCERVAGSRLDSATIARLAARSDGNALFLEELIRAACEGEADGLPATVVAMLQARIGRLDAAERRALRAASVFGEGFVLGGVGAVLGEAGEESLARWFASLEREEIIEPPRAQGATFRFRHALMRDAAYGLLTDEDRQLAHGLAAAWLSAREDDPGVVGEHYLLAGRGEEAGPWFVKAAQRAHERDDYPACVALAQRGRAGGARGEFLGALEALAAFAAVMRWDWEAADRAVSDALELLPGGSRYWCYAMRVVSQLAAFRNDPAALRLCIERMLATTPEEPARLAYCDSAIFMASSAIQVGFPEPGRALLSRFDDQIGEAREHYPALAAWAATIRCTLHRHTDDDLAAQLPLLRGALRRYEEAGASKTMLVIVRDVLGEVMCRAGRVDEGLEELRRSHADALGLGLGMVVSHSRLALANGLLARAGRGALDEAAALAAELLATPGISIGYQAMARDVLSHVLLGRGDAEGASREARAAIALSPHTPVRRWLMVARLGRALVSLGRPAEARAAVDEAVREMDGAGSGGGYAEVALLSAAAEAAALEGDAAAARALEERTRARIDAQAAAFVAPEERERFLSHTRGEQAAGRGQPPPSGGAG